MDRDENILSRLRKALDQSKTLYEGARVEHYRAIERMKDLDSMHPDGSVLHATKVYHVTLQDYRIALRRFTRYLLDGELWDEEGPEDSTTQIQRST